MSEVSCKIQNLILFYHTTFKLLLSHGHKPLRTSLHVPEQKVCWRYTYPWLDGLFRTVKIHWTNLAWMKTFVYTIFKLYLTPDEWQNETHPPLCFATAQSHVGEGRRSFLYLLWTGHTQTEDVKTEVKTVKHCKTLQKCSNSQRRSPLQHAKIYTSCKQSRSDREIGSMP